MLEQKTMLLLPKAFFQRQLVVALCLFVGIPIAITLLRPPTHEVPLINWLAATVKLLVMGLLYPYSRYAVQRIIDYWHGDELVVYDGSAKSMLDRKFAKLMVSLILMLVLGPLCIIVLSVARWRKSKNQTVQESTTG
ncbi:hypothetical protein [Aeromonas sp. AE23HZ002T15]